MKKIMKEKNQVVPDEVLSKEFLSRFKTEADVSKFLKQLHAQVLEKMLEGEMDAHLGYEKNSVTGNNTGNSRNGSYPKKIQTEHGESVISIPRDRNGQFEPIAVPKHESRGLSIEKLVISLYAKGMSVSDIEEEMREIYEIELSTSAISIITNKVNQAAQEWQNRPLDPVYLIVWMDGIVFKVRDNGKIINKTVYLCVGLKQNGLKEVLGMWVGKSESSSFWMGVLTDAGAQIAAGDYARRTDLHTGDEIEALSRSFDKMADAVQEKIADLEADVQRREDFVGAFTHELKTPMTSIIGYADMLHTMQTDPDEQREAAAAIVHEGRRLEALSRKLLALLGLNEEGVELTAVPLPVLWPRLHAACPDVTLRTPAAAPTVRGDADLLLDLLCNLVQNAAKASAPGAPVLVLCAQAGDAVTLTVADRGCGIPPELIPRVTEPFFMVDKSRARRQGGSGLGLALCQRIAAAHGSALRIESEPGRGTRVSVTLPVWKEDAP